MDEDGDSEADGSKEPECSLGRRLLLLRVSTCQVTPPVVVPSELQSAIAAVATEAVQPSPPPVGPRRRVRARRRVLGGGTEPVSRAGGRRAKRRRVPGVRDAAEGDSDAWAPPVPPVDIHAVDADSASASDAEELDNGPRALQLVEYYKRRITRVLALMLGDATPTDESAGTLFRVVCVGGGAAVVFSEGERAYVAWARLENGVASYLCTCGGKDGAEAVQLRSWLGESSTCGHARGLKASFEDLAAADGLADDVALLGAYPTLDNAASPPAPECQVFYATKTTRKKGVFAVYFRSTWAAVVIRNKLNKQRMRRRVQRRPACSLISCAKDHWTCPHATSVASWCAELQEAMSAAIALGGAVVDPFKDVLLPTVAPVPKTQQTAAAQAAEWAAFSDESRGRCSRNLLPCSGEISDCLLFDKLADSGREGGAPAFLPEVLVEAKCFACGAAYSGLGIKNAGAMLHTLRGRVAVTLQQWTCMCGELVPYDGAHEGLFASSKGTVFTRTFMDVLIQMVFTGHGTLSSAASMLCFLLEATDSFSGASGSLARQTLISAVHRYARTLIVPATLFRCSKYKRAGDRPYLAIIADGQVLSILRNQSQPLVRLTEDVVGVPLDAGHGACLASAATRAAVRKRMTADNQLVVRLNKDDKKALDRLAEELAVELVAHEPSWVVSQPDNVSWASAYLYFSFYTNEVSDVDPAGEDEAAAGLGAPADAPGGGTGDDAAQAPGGDDTEGGAAPQAGGLFYVSKQVDGAVGTGLSATAERERWRIVRRFLLTFLGHPVVGALAGLPRRRIRRLAKKLVLGATVEEWKPYASAVESVGIVWPFLRLVGMTNEDQQMTQAIGEVLLFTCGVDAYWETLWRGHASAGALAFEEQWRNTSADKYAEWAATRTPAPSSTSPLLCSNPAKSRGKAQLLEVSTGHVWPDLVPVRPFITDSKAEEVNAARAVKVKAGREALVELLNTELGSDDCRHAFTSSQTFMPGVENFLRPCGLLIGYDFLDRAESPAHVLASLMQRFPVLPSVVYFDTACQMARNASRRVPWLINASQTAASIDRAHRLQKQHGCSPVYDADAYPSRSVRHRTACAESRHSINKAFKTHLVHLRQDHFIVQMRLLGALVNLRVKMRQELGRETNHRPMCVFFHTHVQSYCDRRSCTCDNGRRQQAEAAAAAAAAADVPGNAADVDAAAADIAPTGPMLAHLAPGADAAANGAPAVAAPADAPYPAAESVAGAVVADPAVELYHAVRDAVVGAVAPAVDAAVVDAVAEESAQAAAGVGDRVGAAGGQAAVYAAYRGALVAGRQHGGEDVGLAAAQAAGQSAALAPVQASISVAVAKAVVVAVQDASRASSAAPALLSSSAAGAAAGHAAAAAAVRAAGFVQPAVAVGRFGGGPRPGGGVAIGQAAVRAALRGALLAAGVVVKQEGPSDAATKAEMVGGAGGNDGSGGGVGDHAGGGGGDEEREDLPPGVVVNDSSSDADSSCSSVSDSDSNSAGD